MEFHSSNALKLRQLYSILSTTMQSPSKTLIIRFSSVGDIVLTTPLLRVLRQAFPASQIDFVTRTEYAELVRTNHNLNVTWTYDASTGFSGLRSLMRTLRAERYDLVLDLHNSIRSRYLRLGLGAVQMVAVNKRILRRWLLVNFKKNFYSGIVSVADRYIETLDRFGIRNDGKGPELHIPDELLFGISGKVASLRLHRFEKIIGLCPAARHATKEWPLDRYAEVAVRFCRERNGGVMIFGGSAEKARALELAQQIGIRIGSDRVISWVGELSLMESAATMEYCDVIVTNDSGLMHVAAAMNKKIVAIFGSTVREFGFAPVSDAAVILETEGLSCRPCSPIGRSRCPKNHFRCMLDVEPERVVETMSEMMDEKS